MNSYQCINSHLKIVACKNASLNLQCCSWPFIKYWTPNSSFPEEQWTRSLVLFWNLFTISNKFFPNVVSTQAPKIMRAIMQCFISNNVSSLLWFTNIKTTSKEVCHINSYCFNLTFVSFLSFSENSKVLKFHEYQINYYK